MHSYATTIVCSASWTYLFFFKFETNPEITVSYRYAIKVTVDGPRPPRSPSNLNFFLESISLTS